MNNWDYAYLPVIALLNLGFIYGWHKKIQKKWISGKLDWSFLFLSSFLNTWGIENLQRIFQADRWLDVFQISLGAWLLLSAASAFLHYRVNGLALKRFWIDYAGDLLSYFFIGILVYLCS